MADVSKVKLNGTAYNVKDASVPSWAKQSSKPSYTQDEVGDGSTYKRVTSTEKSTWNNKGTYSKPSGGIPKSDLASAVQTSLEKADTALQSFTESDPTVPSWAKQSSKPSYTASEVGAIATSAKGAANGVASLDSAGKVPSSQLPSYVDDVLEYSAKSSFPSTGETGKIYVDTSTNKTYRWSGSAYVEISASLALGETSSTAYYGDKGKTAYNHSQVTSGNPHNVTKSDVGLGNVGNFKAVSTVANQGLSSTEKSNARANIGAGTGNGTYSKPSGGIPKSDLASAVQTSLDRADTSLQHSTVTGSPDLNTYLTTGVYHIATQTATHAPSTNHGTLFVDATVGTPYQVFKPDVESVFYTRYYYQSSWTNWVGSMTGVKGNSETSYRTGNVNITKANIGLGSVGDFLAVSTAASQGLNKTQKVNARINIDLEPQEIAITAGTGFTVGTSFTYKCNNLAWFSIMIKVITALTGNQTYTCAYVDANTIKRGDSMVPLTAMQDDSFNRINAFFSQWSTQEIKIIPENDVPANAWIIVSGVYRFY